MRFLLGRLWLGYSAFRCCCSPAGGGLTPAADTPPVQCLLGRESADSRERPALTRMRLAYTSAAWPTKRNRPQPCWFRCLTMGRNMNFGQAIEALKAGKRVTREGWNGRGMFLILAGGYKVSKENLRPGGPIDAAFLESRGLDEMEILPHIDMWTVNAQGRQAYLPGWLASQTDMLADDWSVID